MESAQRISHLIAIGHGPSGRQVYQSVDWRSALADALLRVNAATGPILADFEKRCLDPHYRVEEDDAA
jgi:hypothetical protein